MKRIDLATTGIVLLLALAGCASRGNDVLRTQNAAIVDQHIVDGRTTRSDVERLYGPPTATSFANAQNEIWIYSWARATARSENFIPYVGAFVGGADIQKKQLVILFNEQNVVVRHTMQDSTDTMRRNLSASAAPTPTAGQVSTSPPPAPSSADAGISAPPVIPPVIPATRASTPRPAAPSFAPGATVASSSGAPAPTAASIEPGRWTCGMHVYNGNSDRRYSISFVVAADRSIAVASYGDAPATIVRTSPLSFTALNPRGARVITFTLKPDDVIVVTGPGTSSPTSTFYNEGTCVRS